MPTLDDLRRLYLESQQDSDYRFDWQNLGGENKPLYYGIGKPGTSDSSPTWKIQKFTFVYDTASAKYLLTKTFIRTGAWTNRANLF